MSYRWLEHTSELELQIDGPTEQAVFEQALVAVGDLVGEGAGEDREPGAGEGASGAQEERPGAGEDQAAIARQVAVEAPDRAALLAAFLEELVYLVETDDLVPQRLERFELADRRLTATVCGRRGAPRHLVKGVTYHELSLEPAGDGFQATVVLDV